MTRQSEHTPASVPMAQQAGATHSLWKCAKPCVWTDRMLTILIQGTEGRKWFRLIDKVFSERNLIAAYQQVAKKKGSAGVDHVTTNEYGRRLSENLRRVSNTLRVGTYRPHSIRRVTIPKPGSNETRPLGIPTVRDRVVQAAIVNVIEPIFERDFAEHSYGFRPGRSCKDAMRRVDQLLKAGYVHVGFITSSTARGEVFIEILMAGFGCVCAVCCADEPVVAGSLATKPPVLLGQMFSSPNVGCSVWQPPTRRPVDP